MQRAIGLVVAFPGIALDDSKVNCRRMVRGRFATFSLTAALFCRERLVQARLATVSGVAMNDAIFGRFVDSRNRGANLFRGAFCRQTNLFLQPAQVRLDASIMGRSFERLSRTFTG